LEAETERTNGSGRSFGRPATYLDGLKKINDTHGHLVGSQRSIDLRTSCGIHCRAIDTAARYGGDEFALVLPETLHEEAERVANRIRAVMASDPEYRDSPRASESPSTTATANASKNFSPTLSQLYYEKSRRAKQHPTSVTPRRRAQKA